jgi:AcrR family transcriptional regulator
MATRRTPRKRAGDGRRAELVEAAGRVVARDGIAAATTRRIAEEAGLPQGLVHYWFASKDELLEEVIMTLLRQFEAATSEATAGPTEPVSPNPVPSKPVPSGPVPSDAGPIVADAGPADPAAYVRAAFRAAFSVVEADDAGHQLATYELTTWALRSPELRDLARQQYAAYRKTAAAIAAPWLAEHGPETGLDPAVVARFVAVVFDGAVLAWLADPEGTRPGDIFDLASDLLGRYVTASRQAPDPPPAT